MKIYSQNFKDLRDNQVYYTQISEVSEHMFAVLIMPKRKPEAYTCFSKFDSYNQASEFVEQQMHAKIPCTPVISSRI